MKLVEDKNGFFAERFYQSMKGLGTNDATLIRLIVTRSEIDLGDIKDKFFELYNESLAQWIIVSLIVSQKYLTFVMRFQFCFPVG